MEKKKIKKQKRKIENDREERKNGKSRIITQLGRCYLIFSRHISFPAYTHSFLGIICTDTYSRREHCHANSRINSFTQWCHPLRDSNLCVVMLQFRKVAGERREELRWELDRSIRSRATSPDRHQVDKGRATSPQRVSVVPSSVAGEQPFLPYLRYSSFSTLTLDFFESDFF